MRENLSNNKRWEWEGVRGRKREKRENQILQFSLGRFALSPHNCSDTLSNDPVFLGRYPLLYFSHTLFEEFLLGQEESVNILTMKEGLAKYKFIWKRSKKVVKTRPTVMESILNDLFHVFRLEKCHNVRQVKILMMLTAAVVIILIMLIIMIIVINISRSWPFTGTWHRSAGNERAHARKANCGRHINFIHRLFSCLYTSIYYTILYIIYILRVKLITWAFAFQYFRSRDQQVSTMLSR